MVPFDGKMSETPPPGSGLRSVEGAPRHFSAQQMPVNHFIDHDIRIRERMVERNNARRAEIILRSGLTEADLNDAAQVMAAHEKIFNAHDGEDYDTALWEFAAQPDYKDKLEIYRLDHDTKNFKKQIALLHEQARVRAALDVRKAA